MDPTAERWANFSLTAGGNHRLAFRRELLRWRELLAQLYLDEEARPERNRDLLVALLGLTYETSRQIPHLPGLAP